MKVSKVFCYHKLTPSTFLTSTFQLLYPILCISGLCSITPVRDITLRYQKITQQILKCPT